MSTAHDRLNWTSGGAMGLFTGRLLALAVLASSSSCTMAEQSATAPSAAKCTISLTNSMETSPAAGGLGTLSVGAARNCAWEASSGASWVVITSSTSGQGDGSVGYSVAANTDAAVRRTTIDVNNARTTITQDAAECRYQIPPLNTAVEAGGGTIAVHVQAAAACQWSAASDAAWIRINAGASGKGDGIVNLMVDANSGGTRTGAIRVAGHTITFTQAAVSCTYRIAPTSARISMAGGGAAVAVSADGHCGWTAVSNAAWIAIASGSAGTGAGTAQLNIAANAGAARTATATIATHAFTLTQDAAPCTFTLSPSAIGVPSVGGERSTNVTTRSDCAWTAASAVPWITVTAGSQAVGNGAARFTVAVNVGDARSGSLNIGGQIVTVTQEAAPCTFTLSTASQKYDAAGGYGAVGVGATPPSCSWTAFSNNGEWLVITDAGAGTGNGTVNFHVGVNTGAQRSGSLNIGGQLFWITQAP